VISDDDPAAAIGVDRPVHQPSIRMRVTRYAVVASRDAAASMVRVPDAGRYAMRQADFGSAKQTRSSGLGGALIAVLIAVAIVAVIGYFVVAGTSGGYAPTPNTTYAPNATGVPATGVPAPSKAPSYP